MTNAEKLREMCSQAKKGNVKPKEFYDRLSEMAVCEEDSDLGCLLEDALMELEMDGSIETAKETAIMLLEELDGHF